MNSLNKTKAAVFSCRASPFISLMYSYWSIQKTQYVAKCVGEAKNKLDMNSYCQPSRHC